MCAFSPRASPPVADRAPACRAQLRHLSRSPEWEVTHALAARRRSGVRVPPPPAGQWPAVPSPPCAAPRSRRQASSRPGWRWPGTSARSLAAPPVSISNSFRAQALARKRAVAADAVSAGALPAPTSSERRPFGVEAPAPVLERGYRAGCRGACCHARLHAVAPAGVMPHRLGPTPMLASMPCDGAPACRAAGDARRAEPSGATSRRWWMGTGAPRR